MNEEQIINAFAITSFRDIADQDYISARMSYRANLPAPFLWSSLQACEKYFKGILLFNRIASIDIRHNIKLALEKTEEIKDLNFSVSENVREFIEYLNNYGQNRYLEYSTHIDDYSLLKLDETVWSIRRYCRYTQGHFVSSDGKNIQRLPFVKGEIAKHEQRGTWHNYKIPGGLLEKLIEEGGESSKALIWNNFYFGKRHKKKIKEHKNNWSFTNSVLFHHPEIYPKLRELVTFSNVVKKHFEKNEK